MKVHINLNINQLTKYYLSEKNNFLETIYLLMEFFSVTISKFLPYIIPVSLS